MSDDFFRALIGFFAIIDPIGNILVFEVVAGRSSFRDRVNIAALAVAVAFGFLLLFAIVGEGLLNLLDISTESFQIAAGVLLVLPAIRLVDRGELFETNYEGRAPTLDAAVVPLALPMMSGPGALALAASYSDRFGAGITLTAAGIVLLVTFVVFVSTTALLKVVHPAAVRAAARIIGVLLMAIAVDFIVSGWIAATQGT